MSESPESLAFYEVKASSASAISIEARLKEADIVIRHTSRSDISLSKATLLFRFLPGTSGIEAQLYI